MKNKSIFMCTACGAESARWNGQCLVCSAWNSLEEKVVKKDAKKRCFEENRNKPKRLAEVDSQSVSRFCVFNDEWNRTLGGGIVPGSLILLGGDPGVGKSTLVLQVSMALANESGVVLYVSGEESEAQVKMRADRLLLKSDGFYVASTINLTAALEDAEQLNANVLIVDSIQTMQVDSCDGNPGTVSQVKECTSTLMEFSNRTGIAVIMIGHVTKDGNIAGPRMLEHMVDAVLYLEGEKGNNLRVLRVVKNRFGSTEESGIFLMNELGVKPVSDLSHLFFEERLPAQSGATVFAGIEGIRPLLIEVQALTNKSYGMNPRRVAIGYDFNRLIVLLAVLEKKAGVKIGEHDVYINVVGGWKIVDPGIDLAVALSVLSSFYDKPIPRYVAAVGEVGLAGDIRRVGRIEQRIKELEKMGMEVVLIPMANLNELKKTDYKIRLEGIQSMFEMFKWIKEI